MSIATIFAPTALGLGPHPDRTSRPRGTWRAPGVYRSLGIERALRAVDGGTLNAMPYRGERDPASGVRNRAGVAAYTQALAVRVGNALDAGRWPLVLGGDCSVLLGAMLALRRRSRYGLVFLDGHLDFRHSGNSNELSAVAGEDLAVVTGRGLPEHADIDGLAPYVEDADVVALGDREADLQTADVHDTDIEVVDLSRIRWLGGIAAAIAFALARFEAAPLDGFWIHIDLDVLDSRDIPAVDSPAPDGLTFAELEAAILQASASPLAVGAEVTIFDPELDPDGQLAERVTDLVVAGLKSRAG